jgi:hypothetical protein
LSKHFSQVEGKKVIDGLMENITQRQPDEAAL